MVSSLAPGRTDCCCAIDGHRHRGVRWIGSTSGVMARRPLARFTCIRLGRVSCSWLRRAESRRGPGPEPKVVVFLRANPASRLTPGNQGATQGLRGGSRMSLGQRPTVFDDITGGEPDLAFAGIGGPEKLASSSTPVGHRGGRLGGPGHADQGPRRRGRRTQVQRSVRRVQVRAAPSCGGC